MLNYVCRMVWLIASKSELRSRRVCIVTSPWWRDNKKHSENTNASSSVTFDLELWPLTLCCDLTLSQGQKGFCHYMSHDVLYLGTRYDDCECNSLWDMTISLFFCDLWPLPVTFIVCQGHFHCYHLMDVMLLCIGSKYKVCRFNWIWDMDKCLETTKMLSEWRHHPFEFYEI